jgi:hypothetical protein
VRKDCTPEREKVMVALRICAYHRSPLKSARNGNLIDERVISLKKRVLKDGEKGAASTSQGIEYPRNT